MSRRSSLGVIVGLGLVLAGATLVAGASGAELAVYPLYGQWRGTVVLSSVETGEQPTYPNAGNGWRFNRKWSITWNFNSRPAGPIDPQYSDPSAFASGLATITYSRDDVATPGVFACDLARATGAFKYAFREVVANFQYSRPRDLVLVLDAERTKYFLRHRVTYWRKCGLPSETLKEEFSAPRNVFLKRGPIAITRARVRGTWMTTARCLPYKIPDPRPPCTPPPADWTYAYTYTVTVNLRRVSR